ncbi:hypothetical protein CCO04_27660 [Pimelobacter sp. 30-1]|nr:hypothetical protein [Pimelobacter sp. 30-1]
MAFIVAAFIALPFSRQAFAVLAVVSLYINVGAYLAVYRRSSPTYQRLHRLEALAFCGIAVVGAVGVVAIFFI